MRYKSIIYIITLILFSPHYFTFSQNVSPTDSSSSEISPSYLPVFFTKINYPFLTKFSFTEIDTDIIDIQRYDPTLVLKNHYQTLGTFGQAHKSMLFDFQKNIDFSIIDPPYPLYFKNQSDLNFYNLSTIYTKISYVYGVSSENYFNLDFVKKIKSITATVHLNANYNEGYFLHQGINLLSGDALIHYEIPSEIYGFRASYIINHLKNQENGGLLNPQDFLQQIADNIQGYNVFSSNALRTINTHDALLQNYVNIKDRTNKYYASLMHTIQYKQFKSSYFDIIDSTFSYPNLFNSQDTTSDSIRGYSIINILQYSNFEPFRNKPDKNYFFYLNGGIMHEFFKDRVTHVHFNTISPFIKGRTRLFSVMEIWGEFAYSFMGYNQYNAIAHLGIEWAINRKNEHFIGFKADLYRVSPDYIFAHFNSNYLQWDTSWKKQNVMELSAYWKRKKYYAEFNFFLLDNYNLFGTDQNPVQLKKQVALLQSNIQIPFRYKGLGITANVSVQYSNNDSVPVPIFSGKLSTFYVFKIFKRKLQIQIGVDVGYFTKYYANAYSPCLNAFYFQDEQVVGNFVYFDAYANFRVDRIYFFFRFGNLLSPFQGYNMFTTPNYPMNDFQISIGVNWRFHD